MPFVITTTNSTLLFSQISLSFPRHCPPPTVLTHHRLLRSDFLYSPLPWLPPPPRFQTRQPISLHLIDSDHGDNTSSSGRHHQRSIQICGGWTHFRGRTRWVDDGEDHRPSVSRRAFPSSTFSPFYWSLVWPPFVFF